MSKPTIEDVAKLAGVSIKTVSRVVNNEANVRDATRARVQRAIAELNYSPNQSARSLASRRSYLIGLLYDDPSLYEIPSSSYVISIQEGVLKACKDRKYDLLIHPCVYQDRRIAAEIQSLIEHSRLDGLVLAPPLSDMTRIIRAIEASGTPLARIAPGSRGGQHPMVRTNDREVAAAMTQYLASLGHERIAFITGHKDHKAVANRYLGYEDAIRESGQKLQTRFVCAGDNSFKSGEHCAASLLETRTPPTAIFASNDDMAAGVLRVAQRLGLRVPGDLSVAGFDDIPLAQQVFPSLTTIRQPLAQMAELATSMLIEGLEGGPASPEPHSIDSTLVIRDSTGPVPSA
jgi:LacI family transcriptional regulator